ncbi:MAG: hypothetical protein KQH63_20530 [Desulfobulbaceae bacterium]|nr:hypothetical protein [Desulfobulbaceae bacterium]
MKSFPQIFIPIRFKHVASFFITFLALLHVTQTCYAAEIMWDVYDPDILVKGYKIHYGLTSGQYDHVADVGNTTSYQIEDLISPLAAGTTYYFAISVYTDNAESDLADEVSYTTSPPETLDSDGDGLTDVDEINLYGTDPNNSDTDNDTLSDGEEISIGTDPLTPQPIVSLISPENNATLPIGEMALSCRSMSPTSDIDHITFSSDISGIFQQDAVHYPGEILATESGLFSLYHFNNSTEDQISKDFALLQNIEFSNMSQFGESAYFSGDNNSITASNSDGRFDITDELTIEAWVYPSAISQWDYIVSKAWDAPVSPYVNYALGFYNDTNTLRFAISIDGTQYMVTSDIIEPAKWYHVVGTYSNTMGELRIYLNGQLANSASASGPLDTTATDLTIGGYQYSEEESWNGFIDELAIYNRALSQEEIETHYDVDYRNVLASFPMNTIVGGSYEWNCQAVDKNGAASMGTSYTFNTEETAPLLTTFEDAEDGSTSRWYALDASITDAITNLYSEERASRVIEFNGKTLSEYKLNDFATYATDAFDQFTLNWSHKLSTFFIFKIKASTPEGEKIISYWPSTIPFISVDDNSILIGLGSTSADGTWQSFSRNILADIQKSQSTSRIISLDEFTFSGVGQIDDISVELSN